uniref:K Homology domain-containing protein n=1 Tax=Glossina austeni TaxID=7395 RepID=A0A1A9VN68_GLOAU
MLDITRDRPVKVAVKVAVPVRDHPKFNFVGKLLGPKGNSMKRLQEETMCKMAVLGRGSMRDRKKEEEMRASGDSRYAHLFEDLHVEISTFAAPAEAHARIAYALAEVRRFLVPIKRMILRNGSSLALMLYPSPNAKLMYGQVAMLGLPSYMLRKGIMCQASIALISCFAWLNNVNTKT